MVEALSPIATSVRAAPLPVAGRDGDDVAVFRKPPKDGATRTAARQRRFTGSLRREILLVSGTRGSCA